MMLFGRILKLRLDQNARDWKPHCLLRHHRKAGPFVNLNLREELASAVLHTEDGASLSRRTNRHAKRDDERCDGSPRYGKHCLTISQMLVANDAAGQKLLLMPLCL
jgi:hypothetical protein